MALATYPGARTSMISFGDRVNGFLAIPATGAGPFGAVILGHERYGLVQHTIDLTAKFAQHGYVGLAPDMLSRWDGDKEAVARGDLSAPLSDGEIRAYMGESLDHLLAHPQVRGDRIAAMGVCQSGSYPLLLNSVRPEIAANIVMYGGAQNGEWTSRASTDETYESILGRLTAPILGIFGEKDHVVAVDDVLHLASILAAARKSFELKIFPEVPHGWLNDTMPGRYRKKEADEAWTMILKFLADVGQGAFPTDRVVWRLESEMAADYDFTKNVRMA